MGKVVAESRQALEDSYNAGNTSKAAEAYAPTCDVSVNRGRVFVGNTSGDFAGFLASLRNRPKATFLKMVVTKVQGKVHEDVWVTDQGSGSCKAIWEEVDGHWKIVKEVISFTPK